MTAEPIDKYFGTTLSEYVEKIPNELDVDAVGLWQIIPCGRDSFGLEGEALRDFSRRCIRSLLKAGAVPVRASQEKDKFWERQPQYGEDPEEITDKILAEWDRCITDPNNNELWFGTPDGLWFALIN